MNTIVPFNLKELYHAGFLSHLDYYFARTLTGIYKETDPVVRVSCALVSRALADGDICLDIPAISGRVFEERTEKEGSVILPDEVSWVAALSKSSLVSKTPETPLVLDGSNRLFSARYYDFQERLADNISMRFQQTVPARYEQAVMQTADRLLTGNEKNSRSQKQAVLHSLLHCLTIISGGPGTGKTYVTKQIREFFFTVYNDLGLDSPRIICVAPTGKAASKMDHGRTIHSTLKPSSDHTGFYYNRDCQLRADVVIIDEASMIDVVLMTRLLEAIPATAHVILLGDMNQLASVQAGSVFSSICSCRSLQSASFVLNYNFRSAGKSGIEHLSSAINNNDVQLVQEIFSQDLYTDVKFISSDDNACFMEILTDEIQKGYRSFSAVKDPVEALAVIDAFRVLCAHNSGTYGTLQINHLCENILRSSDNFDISKDHFKRIVMVTSNDYKRGLFNGDTGLVHKKRNGMETVYITSQEGKAAEFRPPEFPAHESAFAMTIHKSQGSEFNRVLIVLPEKLSPVVTRQLLYTGVTRARESVTIAGKQDVILQAIQVSEKHRSGLTVAIETRLEKHFNDI